MDDSESPTDVSSNECKRRKIKCNGNTPCQRCGNLNLECEYAPNCCSNGFKDSDEFRRMNNQLATLQEQVEGLFLGLNALRDGGIGIPPPTERSMSMSQPPPQPAIYRPSPKHPSYHGPTSSAFSLDVAKNTLHKMGYQGLSDAVDEGPATQNDTPLGSPPLMRPPLQLSDMSDPLFLMGREEMVRLCRVYEEEMGLMYPIVDIEQMILYGANLYDFVNAALRNGLANPNDNKKGCMDEKSILLKMIVACAAVVEGSGKSELAYRLFENVRGATDKLFHSETIEVKSLPLLALVVSLLFMVG